MKKLLSANGLIPHFAGLLRFFFLFVFFVSIRFSVISQNIGINTTGVAADPSALVEIGKGTLATPDVLGLLIPRVNLTITTSNAPIGAGIVTSLMVYNNATVNDVTPGYYYWDGTKWVRFNTGAGGGNAWLLLGNAGTLDGTNFLGTTDDVPLSFRVWNTNAGRIESDAGVGGNFSNTFLGFRAGITNNTGGYNTVMGDGAMQAMGTTAARNTAIGAGAGFWIGSIATGTDNTVIGNGIMTLCNPVSFNTAVGSGAMYAVSGNSNTALGYQAVNGSASCVNGSYNIGIGYQAMFGNTWPAVSANDNIGIGYRSLYNLTSGASDIGIGSSSLLSNTTGSYNTSLGVWSLYNNTAESYNTALGYLALYSQTGSNMTNTNNVAIGNYSMYSNNPGVSTGYGNVAVGDYAMYYNTTGYNNTAIGGGTTGSGGALYYNQTGFYNTAVGYQALYGSSTISSNANTAVGDQALFYANTGGYNTACGEFALQGTGSITGQYNAAIGAWAGKAVNAGNSNVFLGYGAGYTTTSPSNKLFIQSYNSGGSGTTPLIYGDFNTGQVSILSSTLSNTLFVNGTTKLGSSGTTITNVINATVVLDLPSIATAASLAQTFTVTNAQTNSAVFVSPATALTDGLIICYCRVSAAGTVEVKFKNTSAGAIDMASMNWYFTVVQQ
ncbi:MAG: hypothetical protein HY063_13935 [Bacteroidetes bacterium]|nr:hypothetical protein [Bacteroidota bacterium]